MPGLQLDSYQVPTSPNCGFSIFEMSESPKPKEDLAELGVKNDQTEDVVFGEITQEGPNYRSVRIMGP